jgi:hypothetical protein
MVVTNFYPLIVRESVDTTLYQYSVIILSQRKIWQKNDKGDIEIDENRNKMFKMEPGEGDLFQNRDGTVRDAPSDLTRRILKECRDKIQRDHGKVVVSLDIKLIVYSRANLTACYQLDL